MSHASENPVICAREGCSAAHPGSKFDQMKADRGGWFHQKDGLAWCPADVPDWVPGWRARQAAKQEAARA